MKISDGVGHTPTAAPLFTLVTKNNSWENASTSLLVKINKISLTGRVVLLTHYLDNDTYYALGITATGQAIIKKQKGGVEEVLQTQKVFDSLPLNRLIGLRAESVTNADDSVTLRLLIDKENNNNWTEAGRVTDKTGPIHEAGAIGLATRGSDVVFDNLNIQKINSTALEPIVVTTATPATPVVVPVTPPATTIVPPVTVTPTPAPVTPPVTVVVEPISVPAASPVVPALSIAKSPNENGNLKLSSVTGVPASVTTGNSTAITANIISEGGSNANNVTVNLQLYGADSQVADQAVFPGVNILHENPMPFTLNTKTSLAAGNYALAVRVDNGDGLVNAWFADAGSLTVGSGATNREVVPPTVTTPVTSNTATTPVVTPTPITVANSTNPFSGKNFYVDPYSDAKRLADEWRNSRAGDAAKLDKIANVSQARWLGDWNSNIEGDTRAAMEAAGRNGSYPVFVIYNIPNRDCGGYSAGGSNNPDGYRNWINGFVRGLGSSQAAVVVEPDALAGIECLSGTDRQTRLELVKYAVESIKAQGKTAVYVDAGHPNWTSADEMANRLKSAGIERADGFAINVSNFYGTNENVNYGQAISQSLGGKHFIIDTSRNGAGSTNSEWCNPAGRALGTPSTANTGNSLIDAFFWLKTPGQSDGSCNGGPSAGQWWTEYALGLAERANY
jgi:endoglucanase